MTPGAVASMRAACESLGLSVEQLWVDYVGLGGNLPPKDLEAFLCEELDFCDHDFDMVVQALNEHFSERDEDHPLPYADELLPSPGDSPPAT